MEINDETTQKFSTLNKVKLSAEDKSDILQTLRFEMNREKPKRKFNRGAISGFAAAVAAVAIVAGGFDLEMHNHQSTIPSPSNRMTTASNQTKNTNNTNAITNPSTNSTSGLNTNTSTNNTSSTNNSTSPSNASSSPTTDNNVQKKNSESVDYASEIAVIQSKGYDVTGTVPTASVQTNAGETLTAWIGVAAQSDGHNQYVFFFLSGKYLGTDTATASPGITNATSAGPGSIAVTYPVYKSTDSLANPTGVPVTITYHWNGTKLVPNKPYPKQFS